MLLLHLHVQFAGENSKVKTTYTRLEAPSVHVETLNDIRCDAQRSPGQTVRPLLLLLYIPCVAPRQHMSRPILPAVVPITRGEVNYDTRVNVRTAALVLFYLFLRRVYLTFDERQFSTKREWHVLLRRSNFLQTGAPSLLRRPPQWRRRPGSLRP